MAKPFDIDLTDMKKAKKLWKKAPKGVAKATGAMLNEFAFGTRNTAIEVIREKMIVRTPSFIAASLVVDKTKGVLPISRQKSSTGSVRKGESTGWVEQQRGTSVSRTRIFTEAARRGSRTKRTAPKARMRPGMFYFASKWFPGKTERAKTGAMLSILRRRKYKSPFIIQGVHEGAGKLGYLKSGIYKLKGSKGKLIKLQEFKAKSKLQPDKIPWMNMATDRFFARFNIAGLWRWNLKRFLRLK